MSGGPSKGWPGGSTRAWRKIRQKRLEMDGYQCQVRGEGCTGYADTVHHIYGRALTGDDNIDALVSACKHCNSSIGDPNRVKRTDRRSKTMTQAEIDAFYLER